MVGTRGALAATAIVAAGLAVVSGGSGADPRTPAELPGMPAPFLGTAVVGDGGLTAAIDAYGDVVDLRAPGPVGAALIDNPAERQAAGSVSARTGIVPGVRIAGRSAVPMWRADSVEQRYLAGTSVVRTVATFALGSDRGAVERVAVTDAALGQKFARTVRITAPPGVRVAPALSLYLEREGSIHCQKELSGRELALICAPPGAGTDASGAERPAAILAAAKWDIAAAARDDRRWLGRARPLGSEAPPWARRMYRRSLLVLRALTDRQTGAVAAGARDGWAYVWPRDAAAVALALQASGYRAEARRVARFLVGLDLGAAARFDGNGKPVPGRPAQGDAVGWVAVAARATGIEPGTVADPGAWRGRADYQEGDPGDYLANAIASGPLPADGPKTHLYGGKSARRQGGVGGLAEFAGERGLVRSAGEPASGLDSAAAWAVRPFSQPALFPRVRETLIRLAAQRTRFGITPGEGWPHADPWTAPTAWSAWSLAALGERRRALDLLIALRRAATPAGTLPERVDADTGIPRSTTPLTWSHAFAVLALHELWPHQSQSP
jgi:glucoamylase